VIYRYWRRRLRKDFEDWKVDKAQCGTQRVWPDDYNAHHRRIKQVLADLRTAHGMELASAFGPKLLVEMRRFWRARGLKQDESDWMVCEVRGVLRLIRQLHRHK
jgi:hypothetical protein